MQDDKIIEIIHKILYFHNACSYEARAETILLLIEAALAGDIDMIGETFYLRTKKYQNITEYCKCLEY
jgi:hypothetical protein